MEEKKVLALRIAALEKNLKKKRRNWFLGIWLGYSAVAYWLLTNIHEIDDVLDLLLYDTKEFVGILLASLVIGIVCFWINSLVWSIFCDSIRDTTDDMKDLEKRYNELP